MPPVPQPQNNAVSRYNGRLYSTFALSNQTHCVPIDEEEEQNTDALNGILRELLEEVVIAPISLESRNHPSVLDCGFGKGAWIDDLLSLNPASDPQSESPELEITGIDFFTGKGHSSGEDTEEEDEDGSDGLVEYFRERFNLNASFRESGLRPGTFDLINSRMLADGINTNRWQSYITELGQLLKPGGWLQLVEPQFLFQSDNGRLAEIPYLTQWWEAYSERLSRNNKNARVGRRLEEYLRVARFESIHSSIRRLPLGSWDGQPALGQAALTVFRRLIRSHSAYLFMQPPDPMSSSAYEELLEGAVAELDNANGVRLYINIHIAYGCKAGR